jgi:hypothetical protein
MKIPYINTKRAKDIFRAQGHDVHDLSPCCRATVYNGVCCACGKAIPMPFYFYSLKPVDDNFIREQEAKLRASMPVGSDLCAFVP